MSSIGEGENICELEAYFFFVSPLRGRQHSTC